ncbi:iron uptake porin [Aliterella atlantica]|uniref:iron uptake porin n=1 Tax=Aliterella atlantica TaxID=1827278 RepID=UPI0005D3407D|nr:iron uptake porin [Aliterella atlantica]
MNFLQITLIVSSTVCCLAWVSNQTAIAQDVESMAQVTSVSQLSDVQPTDWAFQALQSLVERYGCIAGYPDSTYRGNRALTRYEFAAGLNACLDRVNELIATASADLVTRDDLATLQSLQAEFATELASVRGRVDNLEVQTATLEANQFSTTTKLGGEAIFAINGVFGDNRAVSSGRIPGSNGEINDTFTLTSRARLALNTSFFGEDLLRMRLQARNFSPFGTNVTGSNMSRLGFDISNNNNLELDQVFYRFPIGDRIVVQVDATNVELDARGFTVYSPFESSGRGAISRYGRFSPIYRHQNGGAGVSVAINPQGSIGANLAYLAPTANNPEAGFGIANGAYAAFGQLNFKLGDAFGLGLTYAHTYDTPNTGNVSFMESTGSIFANSPFGNIPTTGNHYGVEASLRLSPKLIVFGWGGYSQAIAQADPDSSTIVTGNRGAKADIWYYAAGLGLPDLGKEGSLGGILFGQSPKVSSSDVREVGFGNRSRVDSDTSYHLEAFYRYRLTNNIEVTPGLLVIFNPEHNSSNDTEYVGTMRTTFTF